MISMDVFWTLFSTKSLKRPNISHSDTTVSKKKGLTTKNVWKKKCYSNWKTANKNWQKAYMMHLLIIAVMIQKVKRKEPKSPNVQSNFAKSFLSQLRCQIPNKGVLKWRTIVEIHRNENFQKLIILIYTTKVKCSYSAPKFKPSPQIFFTLRGRTITKHR